MESRLVLDVFRLSPSGERLEGEVDCVDLDEELVKPAGAARYRLEAKLYGTELLVRGHLEQDFVLACSRCGRDFTTTIAVDDFTFSCEVDEKSPEVDLTEEIRESIILVLPAYPVCSESCPGVESKAEMPADDRWSVLDNLAKKETEHGKS